MKNWLFSKQKPIIKNYIITKNTSQRDILKTETTSREKAPQRKEIKRLFSKTESFKRNCSTKKGIKELILKTEITKEKLPPKSRTTKRLFSKQIKSFKRKCPQRTETQRDNSQNRNNT
jgi:hypothetical protein